MYSRGGDHPVQWSEFRDFGPLSTARFDHHTRRRRRQRRKILYAAMKFSVCFAEVFQDTRTIDRRYKTPWLVGFRLQADLRLLDLTGTWPTRAGASMAIGSSEARSVTRGWSRSIYAAYPDIEGLWYGSSMHGNEPMVAFYERAQPSLPASPFFDEPLTHPVLLDPLRSTARDLGYGLV